MRDGKHTGKRPPANRTRNIPGRSRGGRRAGRSRNFMDQSTLLIIMAGAVSVSAIALVIQAFLLFGTFKATQTVRDRVVTMLPKVEALLDTSRAAVDEGRAGIAEIREKSN